MKVLLVEPDYRKSKPKIEKRSSDETLWYPPLGLMKLARFHKNRGDQVRFVNGCDKSILPKIDLFNSSEIWDRVYITSLFTFHFKKTCDTIKYYKDVVGGTSSKIFVGGIMASIMSERLFENTGIMPISGILHSPKTIGLDGNEDIDMLPPDYSIIDPNLYAVRDTYYAYTTRGCINCCSWCGVPSIEPIYQSYIDIKPMITILRNEFGNKSTLKLMDNNVLASKELEKIVDDLLELGYGRNDFTKTTPKKKRVIDFNQGLDASFINEKNMKMISKLNIKPMRIAFDRLQEKVVYERAIKLAYSYDVPLFSNYMLYNYKDTPKDLYERLMINTDLNAEFYIKKGKGSIYSYPMRYAPIKEIEGVENNQKREYNEKVNNKNINWLKDPVWTARFTRNIEIIKGAFHGVISPNPGLAKRALGRNFEEFILNLYMPEELLRNRNKYEKEIYKNEPKREPGNGDIESFRLFMKILLEQQDDEFYFFHKAVSSNSSKDIKSALKAVSNKTIEKWLTYYLKS